MERTLAIIKPDAVHARHTGSIVKRIEDAGLKIRGMRLTRLTRDQAEKFYDVHKQRPFYHSLCDYMTSGLVVVMALEGDNAIARWRELMGATDPAKANAGTIRNDFGQNIEQNAVHGSDAPETAAYEVPFFFKDQDLV